MPLVSKTELQYCESIMEPEEQSLPRDAEAAQLGDLGEAGPVDTEQGLALTSQAGPSFPVFPPAAPDLHVQGDPLVSAPSPHPVLAPPAEPPQPAILPLLAVPPPTRGSPPSSAGPFLSLGAQTVQDNFLQSNPPHPAQDSPVASTPGPSLITERAFPATASTATPAAASADLDLVKREEGEQSDDSRVFDEDQVLASLSERLSSLELSAIQVEDWLLLQRRRFDLKVLEEPFHGLQLLLHPASGRFLWRVWGKTRDKGAVRTLSELDDLLVKLFEGVVPCLGFFDFEDGFSMSIKEMEAVEFPVPRVVSKRCVFSYKIPDRDASPTVPELLGIGLCAMCVGVKAAREASLGGGEDGETKVEPGWDEAQEDGLEPKAGSLKPKRRRRKLPTGDTAHQQEADSDPDYFCGMTGNWSDSSGGEDDEGEEEVDEEDPYASDGEWELKDVPRKRGPGRPPKDGGAKRMKRMRRRDGDKRFECKDCGKGFNQTRSLERHRQALHFCGAFECGHCTEFRCELVFELYRHITTEHTGVSFKCLSCKETPFEGDQEEDFKRHYLECLRTRERQERREQRLVSSRDPNKKKPHQCDECGKTFAARTTFEEHKNWHKGLKPIKCPECDFATCFSTSLYTHSKIHMRERGLEKMATNSDIPLVHTCDLCGNRYNQANQLRTHVKRVHEGLVERRECATCGEVFTNRQNLRRHVARAHPKDPSLRCPTCGHVCADRYAFQLHQRVHREPDFMCRFCGKAVKSKQTLQAHERSHTGENPYKCDSCDYACKSSSVLNRHKQAKHNLQPGPAKK